MKQEVLLKVIIEAEGSITGAKEELRKSVMHCNCISSSARKGESFSYKVVSCELI
jgi:hypothetical protein